MEKHYIIADLQCLGQYSHFTTVDGIFQGLTDDYMANDWTEEEAVKLEKEFASYTEEERMHFVGQTYEYDFIANPSKEVIQEWEGFTGKNWEAEKLRGAE